VRDLLRRSRPISTVAMRWFDSLEKVLPLEKDELKAAIETTMPIELPCYQTKKNSVATGVSYPK
jgi:hypothetical protein